MEVLTRFLNWKESLNFTKRGDTIYYDIKGYYKYLKENKLFGVVKYRYLSNRLRMYSTVLSNAVRAIKRTQGLDEMRQTQKTLENDVYLKQGSFKKLYNPLAIKFLMILLKFQIRHAVAENYRKANN